MSFKSLKDILGEMNSMTEKLMHAADNLIPPEHSPRYTEDNKVNSDQQTINQFKNVELLTHELPYIIDKNTKTKNIIDEDGIEREYKVKVVTTEHSGLVSFVLYSEDPLNPRVHVLFRGTHNMASATRNLEALGNTPGNYSFSANKQRILNTIKEVVKHKQDTSVLPVELSLAGHSLGGADTQNAAAAVIKDIASAGSSHHSPLTDIGKLNIMIANAAGISASTAKSSKENLNIVHKKHPNIKVNMYAIMVDGDPIQQAGYTTIFADAPEEQVKINLLKADIGEYRKFANIALILRGKISIIEGIRGGYRAHTIRIFDETKKANVRMKLYTNEDPAEKLVIEKQLKNKVYRNIYKALNPYYIYKGAKRILHKTHLAFTKRKTHKKD